VPHRRRGPRQPGQTRPQPQARQQASHQQRRHGPAAAWLPVIGFGPLAVVLFDAVQT
jgi:hypothetical protein